MNLNPKTRAAELYAIHLALAATDGRAFRKIVMDTLREETGCTLAAAATHYNNAKKGSAPVAGLGRVVPVGVTRPGSKVQGKAQLQDDNECFTVIEILTDGYVGRTGSHLMQGDASEEFDERIKYSPSNKWVMIRGLGPLHGEQYVLDAKEELVKQYPLPVVEITEESTVVELVEEATQELTPY